MALHNKFEDKLREQEARRMAAEALKGPQKKLTPLQEKVRKLKGEPVSRKTKRKPTVGAVRG